MIPNQINIRSPRRILIIQLASTNCAIIITPLRISRYFAKIPPEQQPLTAEQGKYSYFSNRNSFAAMLYITTESAMPAMTTTGSTHAGLYCIRASAYPAGISSTAHS